MAQGTPSGSAEKAVTPEILRNLEAHYGLNKPLWQQYLNYVNDVAHGNLNYSISNYPNTVASMIRDALPWTVGLLGVTTVFSFAVFIFSTPDNRKWRWIISATCLIHRFS